MSTRLTSDQRADIETALDAMADELKSRGLLRYPVSAQYLRAIAIVRDIPPGHRRVRSDFESQRRPKNQKEIEA